MPWLHVSPRGKGEVRWGQVHQTLTFLNLAFNRCCGRLTPLTPLSLSFLQQWHNLRNKRRKSPSELVHCESSRAILSSWAHFCTLARLPRWAICMVCQADMAEVIFQPCKDKVTCSHCCAKMKRCIKCHTAIESKCKEGECVDSAPCMCGCFKCLSLDCPDSFYL